MSSASKSHEHLYAIPIEDMGLSDVAIKTLKRTGITTVGDCVDYYLRSPDALIPARPPFYSIIEGEVKQKFKEYGYWSYVESDLE